jgi:hypothetical protein
MVAINVALVLAFLGVGARIVLKGLWQRLTAKQDGIEGNSMRATREILAQRLAPWRRRARLAKYGAQSTASAGPQPPHGDKFVGISAGPDMPTAK